MARETKAQRMEREEKERTVARDLQVSTYQDRLMVTLERAMKLPAFSLTVENALFKLTQLDEYTKYSRYFTLAFTQDSDDDLQELEWELDALETEKLEEERKALVKANALAKLTDEEREVLNLPKSVWN